MSSPFTFKDIPNELNEASIQQLKNRIKEERYSLKCSGSSTVKECNETKKYIISVIATGSPDSIINSCERCYGQVINDLELRGLKWRTEMLF